jgi:hypothetical protein
MYKVEKTNRYIVSHNLKMPKGCDHPEIKAVIYPEKSVTKELSPYAVIYLRKLGFKVELFEAPKVAQKEEVSEEVPLLELPEEDVPEEDVSEEDVSEEEVSEEEVLEIDIEDLKQRSRQYLMGICKKLDLSTKGSKSDLLKTIDNYLKV